MKARLASAAKIDLAAAKAYYEAQRPGLGADFLNEVLATVERVEELPHAWQKMSEKLRRCRLHRFPYGLIYHVRADEIIILAVAHLHSEPSRWLKRSGR